MKKLRWLFVVFATAAVVGIGALGAQVGSNGTMSGRVLHADGTPAVGVAIGALAIPNPACAPASYGIEVRRRDYSALSSYVLTDGTGRYRLENIQPGRYYLATGTFRLPPQGSGPCYSQGKYRGYIVDPIYYPGVADQNKAIALTITSGASEAVDFRLPPESTSVVAGFAVSGRILGSPVVNNGGLLIVRLGNSSNRFGPGPCKVFDANVAPDGAFEFRNVLPCAYVATVMADYGDYGRGAYPGVNSSSSLIVTDRDIRGIVLGTETGGARR